MNRRLIFPLAMIGAILATQAVMAIALWVPDAARIGYPESGQEIPRSQVITGSAWMAPDSEAVTAIEVSATPADGGPSLTVPAERFVAMDRGKPLFSLHWWSARMEFPTRGEWVLRAKATAADGRTVESGPKRVVVGEAPTRTFVPWSGLHVATIAVCLAAIAAFGVASFRGGEAFVRRAAPWYTALALGNEIAWQFYWFFSGSWSIHDNLYTHMCGIAVLLVPVAMAMEPGKARDRLSELLYFWGVGGAIQALIFPDIGAHGFPTYRFFTFFLSHTLIIAGSLSLATSRIAKITIGSFLRMLLISNLIMIPIWFWDRLISLAPPYSIANYFLLGYAWPPGSVVDLFAATFGPSPWYILGFELMGLGVFGLLWVPWAVGRRLTIRKSAS